MWFGVAPPSPSRVSRRDAHPRHRLERGKGLESEQQSPRRGHQALNSSNLGPLSSRPREFIEKNTAATPRRQMQRLREAAEGVDVHQDNWRKKQIKDGERHDLQPEHGDDHVGGEAIGEELLQLMEGCQIGATSANGDVAGGSLRRQDQVQGLLRKEGEDRLAGTLAGRLQVTQATENQTDFMQLTPRTRRPSVHRVAQSPRIDIERLEEGNNSSREWSTAPAPFASLHPEHLVGHVASVCALVAHDDRFIVSCSVDGSVKVWSQVTLECLQTIYGHGDVVSCLDLNGRWLVSGSHDNTLRLYDCTTSSFRLLYILTGHSGHVTQVRLLSSLPNCILSCSDDNALRLWNAELGQLLYELRAHHSRVTCVDVQPSHICSGAADGSVCFWDVSSLRLSLTPLSDLPCTGIYYVHKSTVQCIIDMGSSRTTVNSELCSVVVTGSNDGTIQLFSATSFEHLGRLDHAGSPIYAAVSLSNDRLLCSTKDGRLLLYGNVLRSKHRKPPAVLQLTAQWISSLQVCGDLVACSSEEVLYIVDASRLCITLAFETQHSFITCTRWIHKHALITAGQDNVIKLWHIT
ncbi:WD domain G-beta repeat [Phytophthora infestans]|nr:WD domain G-beta repeat [Phytophthora infestans]